MHWPHHPSSTTEGRSDEAERRQDRALRGEYKSECRAAVVTAISPGEATLDGVPLLTVDLAVMNPTGMFFNRQVDYHEGDTGHDHAGAEIPARSYRGGTWHWPERVEE